MRIGLISDTHIPRRAKFVPGEVFRIFDGVDLILHAGDLIEPSVLGELTAVAPVEAVCGNVDYPEVRALLPRRRILELDGVRIGLIHGDGGGWDTPTRALKAFDQVDCVVFGHSHRPLVEERNGILLVNPGSPTDTRGLPHPSVGLLRIEETGLDAEIVEFARE